MRKLIFLTCLSAVSFGARIKDIAMLKGARNNQLFGYGLVIGLPGTGDKANELTENSMSLVLKGLGVDVKQLKMDTKNAAAVVVTANLPPFSKVGQQLDVQLASIGTASSLDNGTLMMTALKGPDGKIYAMAQGKVAVMKRESKGGAGAGGGASANMVSGTISGGALLEREIGWDVSQEKQLKYVINNPDFTTAVRIAKRINDELGGRYAVANDASTVEVMYPYSLESNPIELIAQIESLEVEADRRAKVIINSKTGTVVLGEQVRISPVAIAHGNLKLEIKNQPNNSSRAVSSTGQPASGTAAAGAEGDGENAKKLMLMKTGPSISEVVSAINETGASADDLIAILQALKASGALLADLEMQ